MAKKRRYTSVSQMLRDSTVDESFCDEFDEHVALRQVVKHLLAMRAVKRLSQKDIAERMGCSQSRVSKLENGVDSDLRLDDLIRYSASLGFEVRLVFAKRDWSAVDEIKYHAFSIRKLVGMFQDAASKLPMRRENETPYVQIEVYESETPEATAISKGATIPSPPP